MPEKDKVQDYVLRLDRAVDKKDKRSREALQSAITDIELEIVQRVLRDAPDPDNVSPAKMETALKTALSVRTELVKMFQKFYKEAAAVTEGYADLVPLIYDGFKAGGVQASFTARDERVVGYLQQVAYEEYKNLGDTFVQDLSKTVFNGIIGLKTPSELAKTVSAQLIGKKDRAGSPMTSHAKQITRDSILNFTRAAQTQKAEALGIQYYQYVGSLIEDSRPFCVARAGQIFTSEQVDSWEGLDWAGKNPFLPVRVACGGYNCRHHLQPVSDAVAKFIADENNQKLPSPVKRR